MKILVAVALTVAAASAIVWGFHLYPREGADRVKHLVDWDSSCSEVVTRSGDRLIYARGWPSVDEAAVISCEHAGDAVFYARFKTPAALRRAVAQSPPLGRYCVAGREFVADQLFDGDEFRSTCDEMDGRLMAAPPDSDERRRRLLSRSHNGANAPHEH